MTSTTVNIHLDSELLQSSEVMLSEMGLSLSTLVSMCLRQMQYDRKIPFQEGLDVPNHETIEAMLEAESISADSDTPYYATAQEAIEAALAENC